MYNETKRKFYKGKVNTNYLPDGILIEDSYYMCQSVILIDSVFKIAKNCYPQVFLEKCKYIIKTENMSTSLMT